MTRADLVSNFRHTGLPLDHLDLIGLIRRRAENHPVYISWLSCLIGVRLGTIAFDQVFREVSSASGIFFENWNVPIDIYVTLV